MFKRTMTTIVLLTLFAPSAGALEADPDGVFVRVIDVGAGHAAVVQMPGCFYMLYDAGNFADDGKSALAGVRSVIPKDEAIDLMILSHSDADHIGGVDKILQDYPVRTIIRSGYILDTDIWRSADAAIRKAEDSGTEVVDLSRTDVPPGTTYAFGETLVTVISGFSRPPASWGKLDESEERNAGSIVVRLRFADRSVLFTGDAVGRREGTTNDAPIATEKFMVENAPSIPVDSDVLIAPHHGSDDASSSDFIRAVSPEWVIFSAGRSRSDHPRDTTARRYLSASVPASRMLRTDRGDDEGDKEWPDGRIKGHKDKIGDDDIDIVITADGTVQVAYRNENGQRPPPHVVSGKRCASDPG